MSDGRNSQGGPSAGEPRENKTLGERTVTLVRSIPSSVLLVAAVILVASLTVLSILPLFLGLSRSDAEKLGYPGVFLVNFLGASFIPTLTGVGQALIVTLASKLGPVQVGLLGGAGMALAEVIPYAVGRGLREWSTTRQIPVRGRAGRWLQEAARLIDQLMRNYGVPTLFVLAAVPNPVFEFAGITAGATRMKFWQFLLPVSLGKILRALLLAFIGEGFANLLG